MDYQYQPLLKPQPKTTPYAWVVLILILSFRVSHQMQQQALGFIYGFEGHDDPIYDLSAAFP